MASIDKLSIANEESSIHQLNIQSITFVMHTNAKKYPARLHIMVRCLFDSVLNYALTAVKLVLMKWLALTYSSLIYNQEKDTITFEVIEKGSEF